jgi:hypothetical protein
MQHSRCLGIERNRHNLEDLRGRIVKNDTVSSCNRSERIWHRQLDEKFADLGFATEEFLDPTKRPWIAEVLIDATPYSSDHVPVT